VVTRPKRGSNRRVVAAVRLDDEMRVDGRGVQLVKKRRAPALLIGIERKLIDAVPPGMVDCARIEVFATMPIEKRRRSSPAIEMRSFDPVIAVTAKVTQVQAIERDDDGARRHFGFRI